MYKRNRPHIAILLGCLVLLVVSVACSPTRATKKAPSSTQSPPLYPSAQRVDVQYINAGEVKPEQLVSFETNDSTQTVLGFYKDVLAKDGWTLSPELSSPDRLYFSWADGTAYELVATVTSARVGLTKVELKLLTMAPE